MRWSWKRWQEQVKTNVSDADAQAFAEVWPVFSRSQPEKKRGMWAHEVQYDFPEWNMQRVMNAANRMEEKGLASRCPGMPLYVPILPE